MANERKVEGFDTQHQRVLERMTLVDTSEVRRLTNIQRRKTVRES